jgi:hypothetical protein
MQTQIRKMRALSNCDILKPKNIPSPKDKNCKRETKNILWK